jgi:ATP-dependent DNA helicase RecQ
VLDGKWDQSSGQEDIDAPRRLYYVAMTRARQSLLLGRMSGKNRFLDELPSHASLIRRRSDGPSEIPAEVYRRHMRVSLSDVDLSFAGRFGEGHAVHGGIRRLSVGDQLELREKDGTQELIDPKGQLVCRMARKFSPPRGMRCVNAKVAAISARFEEDSEPDFQKQLRCLRWEVVMPELVFEPISPPHQALAKANRQLSR